MSNSAIIGVDLGGTKAALARYDTATWEPAQEETIATQANRGWAAVYGDLVDAIERLRTDDTTAIGIGVPGLVRQPEGVIVTLPNIPGAQGVALKADLENATGLPVAVDNDANAFTLAEAKNSQYATEGVVVGIAMGTGVGGGIVIDGTLYRGARGLAGEIGHMLFQPGNSPYDTDDTRGDVEQFLSGTALGKRCGSTDPSDYLEGDMRDSVLRETAQLCVSLTALLDPSLIVFGGSAGRALEPHLETIRLEMKQWSLPHAPLPELSVATPDDAAMRGAALLAWEKEKLANRRS